MNDSTAFCVALVKDGRLDLSRDQRKVIDHYLKKHEGKNVRLALSPPTKTRSGNQSRYYWGVVLTMIASHTGHTTEEIHEIMKAKFLPREYVQIGKDTFQITKSTSVLSTFGMEEYLEQVRIFAGTELGLHIPLPNEI